jgi:hypothetical protein
MREILATLLNVVHNRRMEVSDMKRRTKPGCAYNLLEGFGFKVDQ